MFLGFPRSQNIVYDVTNIEQHELFEIDASCSLTDVTLERANSLAVVEGIQNRFFHPSATAGQSGISARSALKDQS